MEAAGLAIGAVGLISLFNSCLDALDRIDSFREFGRETQYLQNQLDSARLRLRQWGDAVGLERGKLSKCHHDLLDDSETFALIQETLIIIEQECFETEEPQGKDHDLKFCKHEDDYKGRYRQAHNPSFRRKLGWSLRRKEKRTGQIQRVRSLVQNLYDLIPPEHSSPARSRVEQCDQDNTTSRAISLAQVRENIIKIEADLKVENAREANKWLLGKYIPNELYESCSRVRLNGTCDWILEQPAFVNWTSPHFQWAACKWLWINGPPGFGKTILCSRVTEHLSSRLDTPVAHFFFSSDFESCEDPFVAIRSWISQAIFHPAAAALAQRSQASQFHQPVATQRAIVELLRQIVQAIPHYTFVLDGLDECTFWSRDQGLLPRNSAADLLTAIDEALRGTETRVIVCSRDVPELRRCLAGLNASEYRLTPDDVRSDTAAYARSLVDERLPNKEPELRRAISDRMSKRCEGQFLWLKLQGKDLRGGKSKRKLIEAIDQAPTGLERLYDKQWSKVEAYQAEDRDRVISLLRWAAFALRPLTVCEITEAVLIRLDRQDPWIDNLPDSIDEEYIRTEIVELCASLLEIRDTPFRTDHIGRRTVHLTHFSVKEYLVNRMQARGIALEGNQRLNSTFEAKQVAELAKMCLYYLQNPAVWGEDDAEREGSPSIGAFRSYAAGSWYQHALACGTGDSELTEAIIRLFDANSTVWDSWRRWYDFYHGESQENEESDEDAAVDFSPVYYASHLGLEGIVELLVRNQNRSPDGQCPSGQTALAAAAYNRHLGVVRFLLDNGAEINALDAQGRSALFAACRGGSAQILRLLLERGADVTVAANDGWSPLMTACNHGKANLVEMLLEKGADASATDDCGCTPITIALEKQKVDIHIVEMILDQGVDVTAAGDDGWTPLSFALQRGNAEVVKMMLDRGADLRSVELGVSTPLFMPSVWGNSELAGLLVERGGDVMARDSAGRTPLHLVSCLGAMEVTEMLLNNGADVVASDDNGWTPLHYASYHGNLGSANTLVQLGADLMARSKRGVTPLHFASSSGNLDLAQMLVEKGASIAAGDRSGSTPLHEASRHGRTKLVEWLLESPQAQINGRDNHGRTALFHAARSGWVGMVRLLAERDATGLNIADQHGTTPLSAAARNGRVEVVRLLLVSWKLDTHLLDGFGYSLAWWASRSGNERIVRLVNQEALDDHDDPALGGNQSPNVGIMDWCRICTMDMPEPRALCYECAIYM
ncbi:ankyrin repeats (3 copies) domain-containing protein [Hirsutella rhossiliensis]